MSASSSNPGAWPPLPENIVEAAIGWAVKLDYNQPLPQVRSGFERWLHADPLHALAWQRMHALKQPFMAMPAGLLRDTLGAAEARANGGCCRWQA